MMLAGPRLRVALVTIHHALAAVPTLLSGDRIEAAIEITAEALRRDLAISSPRLAVAGLNPHAGEDGRFGSEEIEVIEPVIHRMQGRFFRLAGPYPADTLFFRAYSGEFDVIIAMYHDQGLIPIKLVHFHEAVNVTLGLPVIRTSVDHGTAYDLAGTGRASSGSLEAALRMATLMAGNRAAYRPRG
jgi:4-hydroxythreonine-4-phosphate dehydrogenase